MLTNNQIKTKYVSLFALSLLIIAILLVFNACEKEDDIYDSDTGISYRYFPINKNSYIVYKVTEITIDKPSNFYDTVRYYLKEYIEADFIDAQNDIAYRVERLTRSSIEDNWEIRNVWSAKLINNMGQRKEDNARYVKLRFPVKKDFSWNGNLYNEFDEQVYTISEIDNTYEINQFVFDSTLTVMQKNSESLIHKNIAYEVYAKDIGLINKSIIDINSQEVIFDIPIEERIETGYFYYQKIVDYSK